MNEILKNIHAVALKYFRVISNILLVGSFFFAAFHICGEKTPHGILRRKKNSDFYKYDY